MSVRYSELAGEMVRFFLAGGQSINEVTSVGGVIGLAFLLFDSIQWAVQPPSIRRTWPVTMLEASEAR